MNSLIFAGLWPQQRVAGRAPGVGRAAQKFGSGVVSKGRPEKVEHRCSGEGGRVGARAVKGLKLTWLVLGEDQAARSHRVEQLTAL